jgi:von Willebrand factor type A domain
MRFGAPQVLWLLLPLALFSWRMRGRINTLSLILRMLALGLSVLLLAVPQLTSWGQRRQTLVLVDRSQSMPLGSAQTAAEWIAALQKSQGPADRFGVVSFGRRAQVDLSPTGQGVFAGFQGDVDGTASQVDEALALAEGFVEPGLLTDVLLFSDGVFSEAAARAAAQRLAAKQVRVFGIFEPRVTPRADVAVVDVRGPSAVRPGEPFLLSTTIKTLTPTRATVSLFRNQTPIAAAPMTLQRGTNVISWKDIIHTAGVASYRVVVDADGDEVSENNAGAWVTEVKGSARVLLMTRSGNGLMAQRLIALGFKPEVVGPRRLSLAQLADVRLLVLENIEAEVLGESGLHAVSQFVAKLGGGLVMTGGRHSFGEGGYRRSPVEDVLPVSLEIRKEQRKSSIALGLLLDASGSMGEMLPSGRTKMQLAAEAAVGALQLLDGRDEASVHLIDTEAHEVQPLQPVAAGISWGAIAGGFSGGGGIYVGVALKAGADTILRSTKPTRHLVLFSDAADSVEPADAFSIIERLRVHNVTVSVIGLGKPSDKDAPLLAQLAQRGGGRTYFAEDASSLPRVFSEEAIQVARAAFVDTVTASAWGVEASLLGLEPGKSAVVGGYNVTYPRGLSAVALFTDDELHAPLLAFGAHGAGRAAALTFEVDGTHSGPFARWPGRSELLDKVLAWAANAQQPPRDVHVRVSQLAHGVSLAIDLDENSEYLAARPTVELLADNHAQPPIDVTLASDGLGHFEAELPVRFGQTWFPTVRFGATVVRAAPVTIATNPEFEQAPLAEAEARLRSLTQRSGGTVLLSAAEGLPKRTGEMAVTATRHWLLALLVLLIVTEVWTRRLAPRRPAALTPALAQAPPPDLKQPLETKPAGGSLEDALRKAKGKQK